MDGGGREAAVHQFIGEALGGALGATEDHHLAGLAALQDAGDHLGLVEIVRLVDELLDVRHRHLGVVALGADVDGLVQGGARQRQDGRGHRGREQESLSVARGLAQQALDVGQEAQIEHLVGLVEDEHLDEAQVQRPAVREVEEAAGGADHDVDARVEGAELVVVAGAAVDGQHSHLEVLAGHVHVAAHLERELTGGAHDEGARLAVGGLLAVGQRHHAVQQADAEGQRLAGAGAGLADDVAALEGQRNGEGLDGEGVHDAVLSQRGGD